MIYSLILPFAASGVVGGVFVVLAGLRVVVRRADVDGADDADAADVDGLTGMRRGVLARGVRGLVVVLAVVVLDAVSLSM